MSRGKKLDLFIGANIEDEWAQIKPSSKTTTEILEPSKHQLFFKKEKRRGKVVTLVGPFCLDSKLATQLLKKFKKTLGCGGAYKENWMEFQGDIKERLRELLIQEEFKLKPKH